MGKFIPGGDDLHAQILIGANNVPWPQAAHIEQHLAPLQPWAIFGDYRRHLRLIFGDDRFSVSANRVVKLIGDFAQRLGDFGWAEEVVLHPRNLMFLLHMPGDVVHRAVAVDQVQLDERGVLHLDQRTVAGPLRHHPQSHLFEQDARGPGVAADVVVADNCHIIRRGFKGLTFTIVENPVANDIVGDMVSQRLRHAAKAFATHRNYRFIQRFAAGVGHRADIVAD
ncbi:Uncharacterised protein [Raoultella ornithinolytica]|nr:Uncharacterised protein [Raoultella ornithinolytica]